MLQMCRIAPARAACLGALSAFSLGRRRLQPVQQAGWPDRLYAFWNGRLTLACASRTKAGECETEAQPHGDAALIRRIA